MAVSTVAEFRRTLLALAEALAEPGRRFTPDQVMLKGHELNPGLFGTCMKPPLKRVHRLFVPHYVVYVLCPLFMNGPECFSEYIIRPVHS